MSPSRERVIFHILHNRNLGMHGSDATSMHSGGKRVWERVMPLNPSSALALLKVECKLVKLPPNKCFILLQGDLDHIYAIENFNGAYYLLRASGSKYYLWHLKEHGRNPAAGTQLFVRMALEEMYRDCPEMRLS